MEGYIFQLNCSQGGVPKRAIAEAQLTPTGLTCDRQAHRVFHGGPDRALCLYSLELINELRDEGHPIYPGSTGENVTVTGLDWSRLELGSHLALGDEVVVEITSYANPCSIIADSFIASEFKRISQKKHPGQSRLYARVLQVGLLKVGQAVRLLDEKSINPSEDQEWHALRV